MLYQQLINFPGSTSKGKLSTDPKCKDFPEIYSEIKPGTWMYYCDPRHNSSAVFKLGNHVERSTLSASEYYQVFSNSDYFSEGKDSNKYCDIEQASVATTEQIKKVLIKVIKLKKLDKFIPLNKNKPCEFVESDCYWIDHDQELWINPGYIIYSRGKWASPANKEDSGEFTINDVRITVNKKDKQIRFGTKDVVSFNRISNFFEPILSVGPHKVKALNIKIGCSTFSYEDYLKIKNYINS